jgi:hypothetical protein
MNNAVDKEITKLAFHFTDQIEGIIWKERKRRSGWASRKEGPI